MQGPGGTSLGVGSGQFIVFGALGERRRRSAQYSSAILRMYEPLMGGLPLASMMLRLRHPPQRLPKWASVGC